MKLIADTYLREARSRYRLWGADGKVRQPELLHPQIVEHEPLVPARTLVAMRAEQLDLYSVTKASQTISGEIVLGELARTLLDVLLAQGVVRREPASSSATKAAPRSRPRRPSDREGPRRRASAPCPWTRRRASPRRSSTTCSAPRRRVILSDAAELGAGRFRGDAYFARASPRSVLCLPILRQAEVVGLLYLENDLLAGAFTPDRLAALELCATQAAISLENALLLARERTARAAAEAAERRSAFPRRGRSAPLGVARLRRDPPPPGSPLRAAARPTGALIDIVDGREIRRLATVHRDPEEGALDPGGAAAISAPLGLTPPRGQGPPHRRARPDARDDRRCPRERSATTTSTCGSSASSRPRTGLSVPLIARGQTLGVLSLVSAVPGCRYGPADLELAQEVARRAATAIDNARLYRASQEAVRARTEFLTVASHELNTPVTSLLLAVEARSRRVVRSGRTIAPEAMDRMLELVTRQGSRLTRLTSDLLDVSRLEAGRLPLELEDVELGGLVREVVARGAADLSRSRCSVTIEDGAPVSGEVGIGRGSMRS